MDQGRLVPLVLYTLYPLTLYISLPYHLSIFRVDFPGFRLEYYFTLYILVLYIGSGLVLPLFMDIIVPNSPID
jgi:hypothetical protein